MDKSNMRLTPGLRRMLKLLGGDVRTYIDSYDGWTADVYNCPGNLLIDGPEADTKAAAVQALHNKLAVAAKALLADEYDFEE